MWLSENFDSAVRNSQPLGHHNFVGGYELLILPIVLSLALSQKGWRKRIGIVASVVVAAALYISGSRGALVGLLGLGVISIGLGILIGNSQYRRRWAIVSCAFALCMALALASNPRVRTLFSSKISPTPESTTSVVGISDGPVKDRLFMLSSTFNILKERPILGIGPGNLSRVYNTFRPIETGTGSSLVQQVHNTPAQLASELGILGLAIYVSAIAVIIKLCISLHKHISRLSDRLMLCGIGGSWLGYGISSLSDYQLENIGIASVLVATTALLVGLADTYLPTSSKSFDLSTRVRRLTSMVLLVFLCVNLQFWARVDVGLYLSHTAIQEATASNLLAADEKLTRASQLIPWDPSYPGLAAEIVLELLDGSAASEDIQTLRLLAIDYFKSAVAAAPNDPWFNQNLASLLVETDNPQEAETYIKAAIRLLPRNSNSYTYYTLGLALLQQDRMAEAIEAFSLEGLANPIFLIADVWEEQPLLSVRDSVVTKTLSYYQQVLSRTNELSRQYRWLYEQWAMISWWYEQPVSERSRQNLRFIVQSILVSDTDASKALNLVEEHIQRSNERSNDMHLLQARLSPDRYLPTLLDKIDGTTEEKESFEASVRSDQPMKAWLNEVRASTKQQTRSASVYAYRNLAANTLQSILHPGEIHSSTLAGSIGLFTDAPREYPQLDQLMADIRAKQLSMN
ncbi:MAG: O-antigen ligase family protein [Cyanobacteria bacterium J06631_9]